MEIQQSDGITYTATLCNVATIICTTSCTCTVTIATLQAAPYSLSGASSVYAKVIATNAVGSSAESASSNGAVLLSISVPSIPAAPMTSTNLNTSVTITWVAPSDGGTAITAYKVAIRQSDGSTFTTESAYCNVLTTSCTVPISVLQAAPYNLAWGASIYATV